MIRMRNVLVALVTCLMSIGALAQNEFTQDSDSVTVAEELFGTGSVELEFADFEEGFENMSKPFVPKAKLIYGGGSLAVGTEFNVTYTLNRGQFAERVRNEDFMWGSWGVREITDDASTTDDDESADNCKLEFTPLPVELDIERVGGGKGSDSVTFEISVNGMADADTNTNLADGPAPITATAPVKATMPLVRETCEAEAAPPENESAEDMATRLAARATGTYSSGTTRKIVFVLPDIEVSGLRDGGASVEVSTTIEQTKSGGTGAKVSELIKDGNKCGDVMLSTKTDAQEPCPVVTAHKVIEKINNSGGSGSISLDPDDDRQVLVESGSDNKELNPQRIALSTIKIDADFGNNVYLADEDDKVEKGEDPKDNLVDDLDGNLVITVSSDSFNDGDVVYIDDDADRTADERERFAMDEGVAEADIDLSDASVTVWYQPSGDAALKHNSEFTIAAATDFSQTSNLKRSATPAKARLTLNGIKGVAAKAYAIARPMEMGDVDTTNVRVTCETTAKAGCTVFLDCNDQTGMSSFGEDGAMIGPGATMHMNQDAIADMLDLDTWSGRLSCDVLSTQEISVQVLTRSHGVLVNNTPVNAGGVDED